MPEFLRNLFDAEFMPHGHCYYWQPGVLWLNVGSDVAIAAAYFTIPVALLVFVRRRKDIAFPGIFLLFGAFILACGGTHLVGAWTVWEPVYRLEGVVKLLTALVSVATAVVLWPLMRQALALPSPAELREANQELQAEVQRRQQAERELRQLNADLEHRVAERTEELRRSNEDLQQFAYVASHDLQEPLRMVSSYMQLLERRYKGKLDEKADTYIHYAVDGATRMRTLIDDLLRYSRTNTSEQRLEEVNLDGVLKRVRSDLKHTLEQTGVKLTHDPLPVVFADRTQLFQILENLVSNAVKYRRTDVEPWVHVRAEGGEGEQVISVEDNGIGMEPDQAAQIFEIFRRLHTQQQYEGSGMGLAIVKRLVERHGGRIWVDAQPGRGSAFRFTVPERP
jgi:signal transduction histidine kinase